MTTRCTLFAAIVSVGLLTAAASAQGLPFPLPYGENERDYGPAVSLLDRDRDDRPSVPLVDSVRTTRVETRYSALAPATYEADPGVAPAPVYRAVAPVYEPPVATYPSVAPVTYVRPTVAYAPVTYAPVTYTPAAYSPVTYRPATYAPVTYKPAAYSPVTYASSACTPRFVTAYAPVAAASAVAAPVPVATGPRVIVRPKVYVEGQPIRNLLKAITP